VEYDDFDKRILKAIYYLWRRFLPSDLTISPRELRESEHERVAECMNTFTNSILGTMNANKYVLKV